MIQLHHLHRRTVTAPHLRRESFSEQGHLLPLRREDVRGQRSTLFGIAPLRSEPDELGHPARAQPREPTTHVHATKRKAPVALEAVPPQRGDLERLAPHGFHRIAKNCLDLPDCGRHSVHPVRRSGSAAAILACCMTLAKLIFLLSSISPVSATGKVPMPAERDIDVSLLRAFVAVAETGSMTRAASIV